MTHDLYFSIMCGISLQNSGSSTSRTSVQRPLKHLFVSICQGHFAALQRANGVFCNLDLQASKNSHEGHVYHWL